MPGRKAVDDHLEDSADGVAGAEDGVDLSLHAGLVFGVDTVEEDFVFLRERDDLVPPCGAGELGFADANDVGEDFDAEFAQ